MNKLFGTDGIRGVANKDLTPELAMAVGRAAAVVAVNGGEPGRVVIGRDTRLSGEMLERAFMAGVMSTGAEVLRLGIIPTPAVAYLTRKLGADAGCVISASHNPVDDNGIKLFNRSGFKFTEEEEEAVEKLVPSGAYAGEHPSGADVGELSDAGEQGRRLYAEHALKVLPVDLTGLKIALDAAYGAAYQMGGDIFRKAGAEVITIGDEPRGDLINVDCGSTNPLCIRDEVVAREGFFGLAFDGDADRVIAVDEDGNILDGDYIMAILAKYIKEKGSLKADTLVSTVMANCGFDLGMEELGINVIKTDVGDRFVLKELLDQDLNFGGEQSGHVIFLDHNTTGDGIITGLMLAAIKAETGRPLSELKNVMSKLPQVLLNVRVADKRKLGEAVAIWSEVEKSELSLGGRGRVLIRTSGTEPLVRVMVEADTEGAAGRIAGHLAAIVEKELS
ncbi:MAG: phosphoglucosamine mutase [Actinomycetota bacterium]